jgi:hypothetical protein
VWGLAIYYVWKAMGGMNHVHQIAILWRAVHLVRLFAGRALESGTGRIEGVRRRVDTTVGTEVAFGINRALAVTGSYANNSLGMYSARRHEVMGGVRISAANRSRVTPYGALTVGAVAARFAGQSGMMGGSLGMMGLATSTGQSTAKFAVSPGGGIDCKIGRNVGVFLDFRAVKAIDIAWYGRTSAGVFFRWN